ncbi:MAG: endonuclease V [Alphaproteobacteria bacterium]|nr:endonuclease V [Alphaproteobacteria bacterium]
MILTTDVAYRGDTATAVGLLHAGWRTDVIAQTIIKKIDPVAPYESGQFYKRELPCILAVLADVDCVLDAIVVDGYVDLGRAGKPGLGRHLFESLGEAVPVIGVAKRPFAETPDTCRVLRGKSKTPLYVTSAGMPLSRAKSHVRAMHGGYRIPTLLKRADRLCRDNR